MNNAPSIQQSLATIGTGIGFFFRRFHLILYTLTVVVGVAAAIYFLTSVVTSSTDTSQHSQQLQTLDRATIKALESFTPADEAAQEFRPLPGRINPFE